MSMRPKLVTSKKESEQETRKGVHLAFGKRVQLTRIIPPVLFDKYHKTPRPRKPYFPTDFKPKYLKLLETGSFDTFKKLLLEDSPKDNPLSFTKWRLARGVRAFNAPCLICGETRNVQMHHIRSVAALRHLKSRITESARSISAKQVPLCQDHHFKIGHKNNWRTKSRKFTRKQLEKLRQAEKINKQ